MKPYTKEEILWLDSMWYEMEKDYHAYWETYRKDVKKKPYHLNFIEYYYLYCLENWKLDIQPPTFEEFVKYWNLSSDATMALLLQKRKTNLPIEVWHDDFFAEYIIEHWNI